MRLRLTHSESNKVGNMVFSPTTSWGDFSDQVKNGRRSSKIGCDHQSEDEDRTYLD